MGRCQWNSAAPFLSMQRSHPPHLRDFLRLRRGKRMSSFPLTRLQKPNLNWTPIREVFICQTGAKFVLECAETADVSATGGVLFIFGTWSLYLWNWRSADCGGCCGR